MDRRMKIVILGLSITSSWGNGHATTYRGLVRELDRNGHDVLFLERDRPWYADNRDLPEPPYGRTFLYHSLDELQDRFGETVRGADLVIVGSYTPEGIDLGRWVTHHAEGLTAFYDIDTPVTLSRLEHHDCSYLAAELIPMYDLYLSFTGGPTLRRIEERYGSPAARPLYCSTDVELYAPADEVRQWHLGYLGTYAADRQPSLDSLLLTPAKAWSKGRFVVAGPMFPENIQWPGNVERIDHLPPDRHRGFYSAQQLTLNITRADMVRLGYSPSVRLFEAAACGCPVVSDQWAGLEHFFRIGEEILTARAPSDILKYLREMGPDELRAIGQRARRRVLAEHTAAHRAAELEGYVRERLDAGARRRGTGAFAPGRDSPRRVRRMGGA